MKPTVIDPKTTTRAEVYALWMNAPNPMVTFFQNAGCHAAGSAQPQARTEIQYASLLVYRQGGRRDQGVLYSPCWARAAAL